MLYSFWYKGCKGGKTLLGLFLVVGNDDGDGDDSGKDEDDEDWLWVSGGAIQDSRLNILKMPKQIHFFFLAALALSTAWSSCLLPSPMCVTVSSPLSSIFWTAGSCSTTAASISWNSCANSIICRSIFWMASCLPWTARSADCDCPRRLLVIN